LVVSPASPSSPLQARRLVISPAPLAASLASPPPRRCPCRLTCVPAASQRVPTSPASPPPRMRLRRPGSSPHPRARPSSLPFELTPRARPGSSPRPRVRPWSLPPRSGLVSAIPTSRIRASMSRAVVRRSSSAPLVPRAPLLSHRPPHQCPLPTPPPPRAQPPTAPARLRPLATRQLPPLRSPHSRRRQTSPDGPAAFFQTVWTVNYATVTRTGHTGTKSAMCGFPASVNLPPKLLRGFEWSFFKAGQSKQFPLSIVFAAITEREGKVNKTSLLI
jgi:hypothetical protein